MAYDVTFYYIFDFFFSSRRRHTRCALVTGVQTCALPICPWPTAAFRSTWPISRAGSTDSLEAACEGRRALFQVDADEAAQLARLEIGRAACRERVCQYVYISVVAVSLTKQKTKTHH